MKTDFHPNHSANAHTERAVRRTAAAAFFLIILILTFSCASQPKEIPNDLEPIEYFQKAQHFASDKNNYRVAIHYYETFIERHPDDFQRIVEAKYEIAFLHYKQGKTQLAKTEFQELLKNYEGENANVLPAWPRILAQKVLKKIENQERSRTGRLNGEAGSGREADIIEGGITAPNQTP